MAKTKQWFTVLEAADYLGVTERWMRRQIADRHIRFNKIGGVIRFRRSVLDELLESGEYEARNGPPKDRGQKVAPKRTKRRVA